MYSFAPLRVTEQDRMSYSRFTVHNSLSLEMVKRPDPATVLDIGMVGFGKESVAAQVLLVCVQSPLPL